MHFTTSPHIWNRKGRDRNVRGLPLCIVLIKEEISAVLMWTANVKTDYEAAPIMAK